MGRGFVLGCGLLAGLALAPGGARACGTVVTTLLPLAFLAQEIGGERARAHALVPPGASPHAFEPRPSDVARAEGACLFVSAGDGTDGWAARLGAALAPDRQLALAAGLGLPAHAWLDPLAVRDQLAPRLAQALADRDAEGSDAYAGALADFVAAVQLQPQRGSFRTNKSTAHYRLKQWQQAYDEALLAEKNGYSVDPAYLQDLRNRLGY